MMKLPVYLNCYFFFGTTDEKTAYAYKIGDSHSDAHPFQLFKRKGDSSGSWQDLSVYASVEDAVKTLLKELLSEELSDEIDHGQAIVNPDEITRKIEQGDRSVAIYGSTNNAAFRLEVDVLFDDLVERK